jgi:hypothetical protein
MLPELMLKLLLMLCCCFAVLLFCRTAIWSLIQTICTSRRVQVRPHAPMVVPMLGTKLRKWQAGVPMPTWTVHQLRVAQSALQMGALTPRIAARISGQCSMAPHQLTGSGTWLRSRSFSIHPTNTLRMASLSICEWHCSKPALCWNHALTLQGVDSTACACQHMI